MPVGDAPAQWTIGVGAEETVDAVFEPASPPNGALFVCAHGAGGGMGDRSLLTCTAALRRCGLATVRFNFLYRQRGDKRPDPMPRLKACFAAVSDHARQALQPDRLILGGRSMGGRVASMLAAEGYACDGLLLLAYPLHPAGQPEKRRDAHLSSIEVPVLCFNGTRDTLCRQDLMQQAVAPLVGRWSMHWLDGADHGFHVLKSSGRTDADVLDEVAAATLNWLALLRERSRG
jgi:predicted alpha/beta-hydrolase family hydrolase